MEPDMKVPTPEPIAPQEPSEAVVVDDETYPGPGEWPPELTADPFAGFMQPNATVVESWWRGLPNFTCSACPYAHLDRARAEAHVSIHGQTFTQGARP